MDLDDRQAAVKKRSKDARERADLVLADVMGTASGREFVEHIIYGLGALEGSPNSDPALRSILDGQRAVAKTLLRNVLRVCRDEWVLMQNERTRRIASEEPLPVEPDEDD